MKTLDAMTPREMCAGLMRGERMEQKLGYTPEAAVHSTADFKGLTIEERDELHAFAYGFADGMAEAIERQDPATQFGRWGAGIGYDSEYLDGLTLGRSEAGFLLYPSLRELGEEDE